MSLFLTTLKPYGWRTPNANDLVNLTTLGQDHICRDQSDSVDIKMDQRFQT